MCLGRRAGSSFRLSWSSEGRVISEALERMLLVILPHLVCVISNRISAATQQLNNVTACTIWNAQPTLRCVVTVPHRPLPPVYQLIKDRCGDLARASTPGRQQYNWEIEGERSSTEDALDGGGAGWRQRVVGGHTTSKEARML